MSEQQNQEQKTIREQLLDELNDLTHTMEEAIEENEHFHTLQHQLDKHRRHEEAEKSNAETKQR